MCLIETREPFYFIYYLILFCFAMLRPRFAIRLSQFVQIFLLNHSHFVRSSLVSTTPISLLLFFFSPFLTFSLCSCYKPIFFFSVFPSFSHTLEHLAGTIHSSFFNIRLQWVPGHRFLLGNDTPDELAREDALF